MRKNINKWWVLVIIFVPFILMFCLHIGIALGRYFGININVPNVDASTWFMFLGSYLGGVMTLAGVIVTLKYQRNIYQHEKSLEIINSEKERLGMAICELNIFAPTEIYQRFVGLQITKEGYNIVEIAAIRHLIAEEMEKINQLKLETMFFTDIYAMTAGCSSCKKPCRIQTVLPEFQKMYGTVGNQIYETLREIDQFVADVQMNAFCNDRISEYNAVNARCQSLGQSPQYSETTIKDYENKRIDVKSRQSKIEAALTDISKYNQNEIPQLNNLAREYIVVKFQNAYKNCFSSKRGE